MSAFSIGSGIAQAAQVGLNVAPKRAAGALGVAAGVGIAAGVAAHASGIGSPDGAMLDVALMMGTVGTGVYWLANAGSLGRAALFGAVAGASIGQAIAS